MGDADTIMSDGMWFVILASQYSKGLPKGPWQNGWFPGSSFSEIHRFTLSLYSSIFRGKTSEAPLLVAVGYGDCQDDEIYHLSPQGVQALQCFWEGEIDAPMWARQTTYSMF